MPLPSITTTRPGHGGGVAGTAVKKGTVISGISAHAIPRPLPIFLESWLVVLCVWPVRRDPVDSTPSSTRSVSPSTTIPSGAGRFPTRSAGPNSSAGGGRCSWRARCRKASRGLPTAPRRSRCGRRPAGPSSPTRPKRIPRAARDELLGARSRTALGALLQFEAAHPHDEPHYYLSFVATHDDHRGQGIGEQLLAENLERIDAEHCPAYLESSNPKNLARYGRLGFVPREELTLR